MYLFLILLDVIWCLIKTDHVVLAVNNKKIKTISAIAMFFPYWISFTSTVQHTLWERFLSFFLTKKIGIHGVILSYQLCQAQLIWPTQAGLAKINYSGWKVIQKSTMGCTRWPYLTLTLGTLTQRSQCRHQIECAGAICLCQNVPDALLNYATPF